MPYPGCGCGNWWNGPTQSVCGPFETPVNPDQGRCAPLKVQIDCEAPTLPVPQCADDQYTVVYQPEDTANPFAIIARLFDECCLPITDENGLDILTTLVGGSGSPAGTCL